jgi:D-aminopeptidase
MARARLRDLGIAIGSLPTGAHNAITDVPGLTVGHATVIRDDPRVVRTGVTVVLPRGSETHNDYTLAGWHTLNGCGEMTGLPWIDESGMLMSPVAITNTAQVGLVRDALVRYGNERHGGAGYWLPVVAETYDGWLNDMGAFALTEADLFQAMDGAAAGPVAEGNVGGGTGMICHDFKGGIGTSSRLVETKAGHFTVGALVQTNYGERKELRVDGVPVGREISADEVPTPWRTPPFSSSIIVVLATDAPLLSHQCRALAQRATVGLARTGGSGHVFSGDIFIAFSTGNHYRRDSRGVVPMGMFPIGHLNGLYDAAAEAVSEAILNALCAAETMTGQEGRIVYALPPDRLQQVMAEYRPRR